MPSTEKVEIRFEVTRDRLTELNALRSKGGFGTRQELINNALSLLQWALSQIANGKAIATIDPDAGSYAELEIPCFEFARRFDAGKDYFIERDGQKFAGTHLLVDLWGASNLRDPEHIDRALREAAEAAGATVLHGHFHHFSPYGGVSGVLVLAETHISIHTWPERDFAAIDIFMAGACNPYDSLPALKEAFTPASINVGEQRRGLITQAVA